MKKVIIVLLLSLFMLGCDTTTDSFTSLFKSFDRQGMLGNIGNNMAIPAYEQVVVDCNDFNLSLQSFKSNPTSMSMAVAKMRWMDLNSSWRKCEVYGFGPLDNLLIKPRIDDFHCNTTNIEAHISTQPVIDLPFINSVPTSDKGLVAAEYLLWGDGTQNTLTLCQADSQRVNYLIAVGMDLQENLMLVRNEWNTYVSTFITNDGNNVSSSLGKVVNYQVMMLNEIKNMKLGKPMGKFDATVIPGEVESYYSLQGVSNIYQNVAAMKSIFSGNGDSGINALLDHLGAKDNNGTLLSAKLNTKFAEIETDLGNFTTSLDVAVVSELPLCEILYQDVYDLYILVKVDVMNQLGLLLTFTDNDGD